jgi:hypothetical protein
MAVRVNGIDFTETHMIALSAARFGIPVIMVSGDDVLNAQLKDNFPDLEYAIVKTSRSISDTTPLPSEKVEEQIEGAARRAVEKLVAGKFRPYYLKPPYDFEIQYDNWQQAKGAARLLMVRPNGDLGIHYTVQDFAEGIEIARLAFALTNDYVRLLRLILNQTPEGKKVLAQVWELWEQRWVHPQELPEWAKTPNTPPMKARFYGLGAPLPGDGNPASGGKSPSPK